MGVACRIFGQMVEAIPDEELRGLVLQLIQGILDGEAMLILLPTPEGLRIGSIGIKSDELVSVDGIEDAALWLSDVVSGQSGVWGAFAFGTVVVKGHEASERFLDDGLLWSIKESRIVGVSPTMDQSMIWEVTANRKVTRRMLAS